MTNGVAPSPEKTTPQLTTRGWLGKQLVYVLAHRERTVTFMVTEPLTFEQADAVVARLHSELDRILRLPVAVELPPQPGPDSFFSDNFDALLAIPQNHKLVRAPWYLRLLGVQYAIRRE